jgi:hypothetical protein
MSNVPGGKRAIKSQVQGSSRNLRVCTGCGHTAPALDGPTHPYIGASSECWARYGELLARGAGIGVDTYAVQHPGVPGRRAVQSVGAHLTALCLQLERGQPAGPDLLRGILASRPPFRWLEPPSPNGTLTVADVLAGVDEVEWARDVWRAWSPHHDTVRTWLA